MTEQTRRSMALLLAYGDADLGDERDILRALRAAGTPDRDITDHIDNATEDARQFRAGSHRLAVS
jgi:hypothetical protein